MEGMLSDLAVITEQAASFHTFCKENADHTGTFMHRSFCNCCIYLHVILCTSMVFIFDCCAIIRYTGIGTVEFTVQVLTLSHNQLARCFVSYCICRCTRSTTTPGRATGACSGHIPWASAASRALSARRERSSCRSLRCRPWSCWLSTRYAICSAHP